MLSLATPVSWFSICSIEELARAKILKALGSESLYGAATAAATIVEVASAPLIGRLADRLDPLPAAVAGIAMHLVSGVVIACADDPLSLSIAWCVPFGYALTCPLYVAYARLVRGMADAVGTCNTLMSARRCPPLQRPPSPTLWARITPCWCLLSHQLQPCRCRSSSMAGLIEPP